MLVAEMIRAARLEQMICDQKMDQRDDRAASLL